MRKPSPAMMVALAALFVALGGAGIAGTGDNFILGNPNSASSKTSLSATIDNPALAITNTSGGSSATALGLNVASGHAPFTVNSGTKVASLNADKLDGLDSTALQKRVTGVCASGAAIRSIASNGTVACQDASIGGGFTAYGAASSLPLNKDFTTNGGPVLVLVGGSGYRSSAQGGGVITLTPSIDGGVSQTASVYSNEVNSHKALVPVFELLPLAAGPHSFTLQASLGTFNGNDRYVVEVLELPG